MSTDFKYNEIISPSEWPSVPEYQNFKQKYVPEFELDYEKRLLEVREVCDFSDKEYKIMCKLIAHFRVGLSLTNNRYGTFEGDKNIKLEFLQDVNLVSDGSIPNIGYSPENDSYVFDLDWFSDLVKNLSKNSDFKLRNMGGIDNVDISPYDVMEISGVEETSHRIFKIIKSKNENDMASTLLPSDQYWKSEAERRAMLWKLGYVKRYFSDDPNYYSSLKETKTFYDLSYAKHVEQNKNNNE